jgi:hypothetical protein
MEYPAEMARCGNCQARVPRAATACPACGEAIALPQSRGLIMLLVVAAVIFAGVLYVVNQGWLEQRHRQYHPDANSR